VACIMHLPSLARCLSSVDISRSVPSLDKHVKNFPPSCCSLLAATLPLLLQMSAPNGTVDATTPYMPAAVFSHAGKPSVGAGAPASPPPPPSPSPPLLPSYMMPGLTVEVWNTAFLITPVR